MNQIKQHEYVCTAVSERSEPQRDQRPERVHADDSRLSFQPQAERAVAFVDESGVEEGVNGDRRKTVDDDREVCAVVPRHCVAAEIQFHGDEIAEPETEGQRNHSHQETFEDFLSNVMGLDSLGLDQEVWNENGAQRNDDIEQLAGAFGVRNEDEPEEVVVNHSLGLVCLDESRNKWR